MSRKRDKRFFDFMCSCGEEGKERCERVYDEVMAHFQEKYDNKPEGFRREVADREFVDLVIGDLWHGLDKGQADITGIYTDMWSGIAVKYQYDYKEGEWKTQSFWVECDRIHHGLARVYQLVRDFDATL